jgi:hypothetical protein
MSFEMKRSVGKVGIVRSKGLSYNRTRLGVSPRKDSFLNEPTILKRLVRENGPAFFVFGPKVMNPDRKQNVRIQALGY